MPQMTSSPPSVRASYRAGDSMAPAYNASADGHVFGSVLALMSKHLLLSSPRNSTVPAHAPSMMNHTKKMKTFMMYCAEEKRVLTKSAPDLNLDSVRSGLTARMARKEFRPSAPPLTKSRHTNEMITTIPSKMFQPFLRYASSPKSKPDAHILTNISNMKRKVKKTSVPSLSAAFAFSSNGSYSAAMRRQLTMMLTKIMLLKFLSIMIAMASLRGNCSRSNIIRLSGFFVMSLREGNFWGHRVSAPRSLGRGVRSSTGIFGSGPGWIQPHLLNLAHADGSFSPGLVGSGVPPAFGSSLRFSADRGGASSSELTCDRSL